MTLCLILLALLLSGCSPVTESEETSALTRVIAQPLQASDHYPVLHRFNGRVIAPEHSQIGFEQAGRIVIFGDLPKATDMAQRIVSLPIHPMLSSEQVNRIISTCNQW